MAVLINQMTSYRKGKDNEDVTTTNTITRAYPWPSVTYSLVMATVKRWICLLQYYNYQISEEQSMTLIKNRPMNTLFWVEI